MKIKTIQVVALGFALVLLMAGFGYRRMIEGRPAPIPVKQKVMQGVTYIRMVRYLPHSMVVHILVIDRKVAAPRYVVTPADQVQGGALKARTVSQFLAENKVQIAINGDGFFPWWSRSLVDYYPHPGDPVTPNGLTVSHGQRYADGLQDIRPEPTLYISRRNELTFNKPPNKVFHAISGDRMLVQGGQPLPGLDDLEIAPRTAIGTNRNGRYTYLVVVDGRQPYYSQGASLAQLADLLQTLGAFYAMNLDGGGSSTMVIEGQDGQPVLLNSPIDGYIPGRERPVANHLGVFLK